MPYSSALVFLLALFNIVLSTTIVFLAYEVEKRPELIKILGAVVLDVAMVLFSIYALMYVMGYKTRAVQTFTAYLGYIALFNIVILPMVFFSTQVPPEANPFAPLILLLIGWSLVINTNIFRYSFSIGIFPAVILVIGLEILSYSVRQWILPVTAT